jgi:excisionase family DNA binding protein
MVTMEEAAQRLGVSSTSIRRLIKLKKIPATQVVACAPWQIPVEALDLEIVRKAVGNIKARVRVPRTHGTDQQQTIFSIG